jgi:hypothetical protein
MMAYQSVAEILDMISGTHERLYEHVRGLNDAQAEYQSSAEAWTIAQIVEHLGIVAGQFLRLTNKLLAQAEAAGAQASADLRIAPVTLPPAAESSGEKMTAPESALPRGNTAIAESMEKIEQARTALLALRSRLEAADLSQAILPHFAFGPLNLYQWLALIGAHQERHINQIEAIKSASSFPA